MFFVYCFFFFKQKTAYEMRISDWSSDVCSSDLLAEEHLRDNPSRWYLTGFIAPSDESEEIEVDPIEGQDNLALEPEGSGAGGAAGDDDTPEIGRASCRERVCQYV